MEVRLPGLCFDVTFIPVNVNLQGHDAELCPAPLAELYQVCHGRMLVNDRYTFPDGYSVLLQLTAGHGFDIGLYGFELCLQGSAGEAERLIEMGQFSANIIKRPLPFVMKLTALDVAGGQVDRCLCHDEFHFEFDEK